MKHWTKYGPKEGKHYNIVVGVRPRLLHWLQQTRGNKSRSRYIREILTKAMNGGTSD